MLAEEQAALRRVATLVAGGVPPEEVFASVVAEVGQLLDVDFADMGRYEPDRTLAVVASWGREGGHFPVGSRRRLGGKNLSTMVAQTGRPARIESYWDASGPIGLAVRGTGFRSGVGTPIIVDGRLWGLMVAGSSLQASLPADTEARLASFTELLASAIANAESSAGLARVAGEQAALRRVATLVARGTAPEEVFAAVTEEVGRLLPVDSADMGRYEPDGTLICLASWGEKGSLYPVGARLRLEGNNLGTLVFKTGRPARLDDLTQASGTAVVAAREGGVRSAVATPIVVDGRLWGVMAAGSSLEPPLPADTDARLANFTELLATAVANAESRAALAASRARVVAAADATRRRIERDLHDGTQQQLVSLILEVRATWTRHPSDVAELRAQLARTEQGLARVLEELREISHGIHPAILSKGGLEPALRALARRSSLPVEADLHADDRLPEHVEVAVYYVVAEALTNAAKHAHASVVNVELEAHDAIARLRIRDDGTGGADPRKGSGLVGISDRIDALGGTLEIASSAGRGTTLLIEIPFEGRTGAGSTDP